MHRLMSIAVLIGCSSSSEQPALSNRSSGSSAPADPYEGLSAVAIGEKLFATKGCNACHSLDGRDSIGPTLAKVWGTSVPLSNGSTVTFDENYVRESILAPDAKVRVKYPPGTQPSYEGQLTKREIDGLIAFIKSKT